EGHLALREPGEAHGPPQGPRVVPVHPHLVHQRVLVVPGPSREQELVDDQQGEGALVLGRGDLVVGDAPLAQEGVNVEAPHRAHGAVGPVVFTPGCAASYSATRYCTVACPVTVT